MHSQHESYEFKGLIKNCYTLSYEMASVLKRGMTLFQVHLLAQASLESTGKHVLQIIGNLDPHSTFNGSHAHASQPCAIRLEGERQPSSTLNGPGNNLSPSLRQSPFLYVQQ